MLGLMQKYLELERSKLKRCPYKQNNGTGPNQLGTEIITLEGNVGVNLKRAGMPKANDAGARNTN